MGFNQKRRLSRFQGTDGSYSGTDVLINMEHSLPNYSLHISNLISNSYSDYESSYGSVDHIIDFGAGLGTIAELVQLKLHKPIMCMEIDKELQKELAKRNFEVFEDLDGLDGHNLIYTVNVLEHIENDAKALANLARNLNPRGLLIIYVPAHRFLFTSLDSKVGHYRRYSRKNLVQKVSEAGLEINSFQYVDCLGGLATLLLKILGKRSQASSLSKESLRFFDIVIFPLSKFLDKLFFKKVFGKNIYLTAIKES